MSNPSIVKANTLIEASYLLTLQEQRLILACLSKIDSRNPIPDNIDLTVSEFSLLMGIDIKIAYKELYDAAERLYEQSIKIESDERIVEFRWISCKVYKKKGEGKITLTWSPQVKAYISQLKSRFTSYKLKHVAKLQSTYSLRLYEILMQFDKTGCRLISITDLKVMLNLEKKYPEFRDFNKWVIKTAVNELNQCSDLIVNYDVIRLGRKASSIRFQFGARIQEN